MAIKKYFVVVDNFGTTRWYKDTKCNILHRENAPAVEYVDGHVEWWRHDQLHRIDGPAVISKHGDKYWYQNNRLHRTDGPAIEYASGTKAWFQNGLRHRTGGPAIESASGRKMWYINGEELSEAGYIAATQPVVELTVADVEKLLGRRVKIVK